MKRVIIENLKGIKKLDFNIPSSPGVYLITGVNGVGKSTLLSALYRICNASALKNAFRASSGPTLDDYRGAKITYQVGEKPNEKVTFQLKNSKWSPTKRNVHDEVLRRFGYSDAVCIMADAKRIARTHIDDGKPQKVDTWIQEQACYLFDNEKFRDLSRRHDTQGTRGRGGSHAFALPITKNKFYSEKSFSTGEMAILRILEDLYNISTHSLVLLDEAELALHPCTQVRLLNILKKLSQERDLTVIISTHSLALIQSVKNSQIIFLEKADDGIINIISPCYASYAIGMIFDYEHRPLEAILCVEDEFAAIMLESMIHHYKKITGNHSRLPDYRIIAAHGYESAASFAAKLRMDFPLLLVKAVLDDDVYHDNSDSKLNTKFQQLRSTNRKLDCSLGCTAEIAIIETLQNNTKIKDDIYRAFHKDISRILSDQDYKSIHDTNNCRKAKLRWEYIEKALGIAENERKRNREFFANLITPLYFETSKLTETINIIFSR